MGEIPVLPIVGGCGPGAPSDEGIGEDRFANLDPCGVPRPGAVGEAMAGGVAVTAEVGVDLGAAQLGGVWFDVAGVVGVARAGGVGGVGGAAQFGGV
ncbi:MAG: hypothetical protein ACKV2O_21320, partial [Acidimicrobiales bacterium]